MLFGAVILFKGHGILFADCSSRKVDIFGMDDSNKVGNDRGGN